MKITNALMNPYSGNTFFSASFINSQTGRYAIITNNVVISRENPIDFTNNFFSIVIWVLIKILFQFNPLPRHHIVDLCCHITGMIPASFQIPGDHDIMGADRDVRRVLHHIRDAFPED
jgi:hypothetical protein